ncbi:hypothetical protein [Ornithinimicrobium avium]|uniref:Uncharacterized protein n=1 Tax=Ornithinimicrobium avium TaxID=2283195 RepID=A0A345NKG1_9MICO|nr:hypothetical protein [Ornithinimicrobium avium]AXH95519.1 hypothetical protein DV701_04690 [Ornithinimicrobium avium]
MTARRLSREEFHTRLATLERGDLVKVLWTLYWRGPTPVRERIEDLLDPQGRPAREQVRQAAPDAAATLAAVTEFAALARSGAYLGRDRRVSPKERTRWRMTFRSLASASQQALLGEDVATATRAVSTLVDLACETKDVDYFRSQDPMEAARFVVSDVVGLMWARLRDTRGAGDMVQHAVTDLVRWERPYGWTRTGFGWVAGREASLASVLAGLLTVPDLWQTAAHAYVEALDDPVASRAGGRRGRPRRELAEDLAAWNTLLLERLAGPEHEELLARVSTHARVTGRS